MACPSNAFPYNGTLCACNPGYYQPANSTCAFFGGGEVFSDFQVGSGAGSGGVSGATMLFLTSVLSVDAIRKLTQSQALLLVATLAALFAWLVFCAALRLTPLDAMRPRWFELRLWVSRLDCLFDNAHWTEDRQVVKKRKTEFGGMCSMASFILFVGLLTALLYQIITKRNIEVHRVRPVNAPDLLSFVNDLEFHITTVSSMTCANLVPPDTLVMGTPGFIDYRVFPLSTLISYECQNTSQGPAMSLKCSGCWIPLTNQYISWQFIDLPKNPAVAVGFKFNLTAKDHNDDKHVSFVSGTIKPISYIDNKSRSLRGNISNVLKIQLFPQIYDKIHYLKLYQPLLQDFIPGSSVSDVTSLQASLLNPNDGLINTTLMISYLSDYIVEIGNENVLGPVSIMASIGGLYAISTAIFLCLMVQCEARSKKLRNEDFRMLQILSRRRAQRNWDKVRKFVMYTWGPSDLIPTDKGGSFSGHSSGRTLGRSLRQKQKSSESAALSICAPEGVQAKVRAATEPSTSNVTSTKTKGTESQELADLQQPHQHQESSS